MEKEKLMKVTLKRSSIGCTASQRATLNSLGLRRLHHSICGKDHPALRGQLRKIQHLIQVEILNSKGNSADRNNQEGGA